MIDTNKLNDIVTVWQWDHQNDQEVCVKIRLIDAIINPRGLKMANLCVILLNKFREDLGLEPIGPDQRY